MACQIKRTNNGLINRIETPTGERSQLFDAIHSNVFLADAETSLKIYNNAYSDKVKKTFESSDKYTYETGEPALFYKSSNNVEYDNLEELLINEETGNISIGFKNPYNDEFMPIANFTNKGSEKNEFLTSKVKEGLLSAERVLGEDGVTRYQGKGNYTDTKVITGLFVKSDLASELGNGRIEVNPDGTIDIEFAKEYSEAVDMDGNVQPIQTENIPEYLEKNPDTINREDLVIEYAMRYLNPRLDKKVKTSKNNSVKSIEKSLIQFLKDMGFSITTIDNYRNNYKTKYGEGKDISAIADIANMVVAFRNGELNAEDLSEEVAHIAIEAFSDQNAITSALVNVHLTPEYAEFSERYRKRYKEAGNLTDIQLEDKVRKEILGKILKKEIMGRFSTDGRTESQNYTTSKLREIWRWFTDMLWNKIQPYHSASLNNLNKKIADSILNKSSQNFKTENLKGGDFFYNLMDEEGKALYNELQQSKKYILDLYRNILKEPTSKQAELDRFENLSNNYDIVNGVTVVISQASNQLKQLIEAVKKAEENSEVLDSIDSHRYTVLKENLLPSVDNLIHELNKLKNNKGTVLDTKLKSAIEGLNNSAKQLAFDMTSVNPLINAEKLNWVDKLLTNMLERFTLTQEERESIRKSLDGGFKDIGWLGKTFGLSSHSKNLALQLMHLSVMNITTNTNSRFLSNLNEKLSDISEKGIEKYQKTTLNTKSNGGASYYLRSFRDYEGTDELIETKKIEIISQKTGKDIKDIKRLLKNLRPQEIIKDDKKFKEYERELKEFDKKQYEQRFTEDYYKEGEERYKKAEVADETIDYLSQKNNGYLFRNKAYFNEDGTIDRSKQPEANRLKDQEDFKNHLQVSNAYDVMGNLKEGLKRAKYTELTEEQKKRIPSKIKIKEGYDGQVTIYEDGYNLEDLPLDSRIAFDISNLNLLYSSEIEGEVKTITPIKRFTKSIVEIEKEKGDAYSWLISNARISFSSEFYESMGENETTTELKQRYINEEIIDPKEKARKQAVFEEYVELQKARKEVLKQNKKAYSSTENDVHYMSDPVRQKLLDMEAKISSLNKNLGVPYEYLSDNRGTEGVETDLNEDFYMMLEDAGSEIFEFAQSHMTQDKADKTRQFIRQIDDYVYGRSTYLQKDFSKFVKEVTDKQDLTGLTLEQMSVVFKNEYAKRNIASYFTRFQPTGYSKLLDKMKSGEISISKIIEKDEQLYSEYPILSKISITPEYSWRENVNNDKFKKNPNFKVGDSFRQPKKLNHKTFEYYGIKVEDYLDLQEEDLNLLTPTKNIESYELLKIAVQMNKDIIEEYGNTGKVNPYLRQQIKKDVIERAFSIHKTKGKDLKDAFLDFATSQKDEKEYGEEIEGSSINVKVVPKYYQEKVEDPAFLTENVIFAGAMGLKAAIKHTERLKAEKDVKAIEYKISQQKFKNSGGRSIKSRISKKGEVSNYYAKTQEMSDYHLYGIKQNRKIVVNIAGKDIDFTQFFTGFTNYVRNVNLKYNPIVDLTSYTTGLVNNLIDRAIGDYYHKSSADEASKRMPKLIKDYLIEEGKLMKTSDLNHLMEFVNIMTPENDRLGQSSFKRIIRMASESGYLLSKYGNLPITPKNMVAIMLDFKFHEGKFIDYNNFSRKIRNEQPGVKKAEINALWKQNKDTYLSNLTIDKNKGVIMGDKFTSKFESKEIAEKEFNTMHQVVSAKITQVNQSVDAIVSNEDQLMAQRDVITNAFMMHRSWSIINMTRKFKDKHFNLAAGQYEEGHYRTVLSFIRKTLSHYKKGGRISEGEKQSLLSMFEEYEIRNLKRLGVDGVAITMLIGLVNAMMLADDDDDTYIENLAQLIAMRTASETQSQSIIGMPGTIKDIYKQPLVQTSMVTSIFQPSEAKDPKYDYDKMLRQTILFRRKHQFGDLEATLQQYMHFNQETLKFIDAADETK